MHDVYIGVYRTRAFFMDGVHTDDRWKSIYMINIYNFHIIHNICAHCTYMQSKIAYESRILCEQYIRCKAKQGQQ